MERIQIFATDIFLSVSLLGLHSQSAGQRSDSIHARSNETCMNFHTRKSGNLSGAYGLTKEGPADPIDDAFAHECRS